MSAEDAIKQGDLDAALAKVQQDVRSRPGEAKLRVFLFQLLALNGQWGRALNQLKVAGQLDASALLMVEAYSRAIACEALRKEVFEGKRLPLLLGEPQEWLAKLLQALSADAAGQPAQAAALRQAALDAAQPSSGSIDGKPFEWIADADGCIGPCLEALIDGKYYWVPFANLRKITIEEPTDLRDLVWAPAQLTLASEGSTVAFIPTRYSGTELSGDPLLRLARKTEWIDETHPVGQRMFVTESEDYPLLQTRVVDFTAG